MGFSSHAHGDSIWLEARVNDIVQVILLAVLLLAVGAFVFRKTGRDYDRTGRLSKVTSSLSVAVFVLHAASSYVFLDSRLSTIDIGSPLFGFALLLLVGGAIMLGTTVGRLGMYKTTGQEASGLTCSGMYRKTRNPQIMFYGMVVIGYSLLWPSWTGATWVVLYAILAQMMVRTEEKHLKKTYGAEYVEYCEQTPRYIDLPGIK